MFAYTMVMTILWLLNVITFDQFKVVGLVPFAIYGTIMVYFYMKGGAR